MTTAYNLTNMIIRAYKRSSYTSTYASITRSVFENSLIKELSIPVDINAYNHHMKEIDIKNQYQTDFTTLQHQNQCYWKLLFYWLLDIALVNSYLLYKAYQKLVIEDSKRYRRDHRRFQEGLAKALMTYCETPEHNQILRPTRSYCAHCRKNQLNWEPKFKRRAFGADITNIVGGLRGGSRGGSGGRFRGSCTRWGCDQCNIPLCKIGDCWRLWHEKFNYY